MSSISSYRLDSEPSHATLASDFSAPEVDQAAAERRMPGFLSILLGLYLLSVPLLSFSAKLQANYVPQAIGVVLALLWLVGGLPAQGWRPIWPRPIMILWVFVLWALSGLLVTVSVPIFLPQWLSLVKITAMAWLAAQVVRHRADMLACWVFVILACILIFVVDRGTIMGAMEYTGGHRADDTLAQNANSLAYFSLAAIIAALCLIFATKSWTLKALGIAAMPILLLIVAASGSRKGMVCLAIIAIGLYFLHFRRVGKLHGYGYRLAMFIAGSIIALGTLYLISTMPFIERIVDTMSSSTEIRREARYVYFIRALEATAEHPVFGLGLEGFAMAGLSGMKGHYSHSTPAETLSCTGIPGFLLYYGAILSLLIRILKARRLPLEHRDMAMVNMMLIYLLLFILYSLASVMIHDRLSWPIMGAMYGYLLNLGARSRFLATAEEAYAYAHR